MKPFLFKNSTGNELEIDPGHDGGHVVLAVEDAEPCEELSPGYSVISLPPAALRALRAWIDLHFETLPPCPECGADLGVADHAVGCPNEETKIDEPNANHREQDHDRRTD